MALNTISHGEICSSTVSRLGKGVTTEMVDKTLREYNNALCDLASEKMPTNAKDFTLIETPIVGIRLQYRESGIKKNPDGSTTTISPHCAASFAAPNQLLKAIDADAMKKLLQAAPKIASVISDVAKIIKPAA